jgi:GH24 family phage-related lysozyme (muramidase)
VISRSGLDLIKQFEGCRLKAYRDAVGVYTIGYGVTRIAGMPVKPGLTITQAEAELLLQHQAEEHWRQAEQYISQNVALNQNQIDALASFVYNVGVGAFKDSTLLKMLNGRLMQTAADEFLRWKKAKGKTLRGLVRRRQAERALFLEGAK